MSLIIREAARVFNHEVRSSAEAHTESVKYRLLLMCAEAVVRI